MMQLFVIIPVFAPYLFIVFLLITQFTKVTKVVLFVMVSCVRVRHHKNMLV